MSLLPLTFQLSSGTNQEFEDDNSSSRLGGGTAEGGGFSPALWPPRLPSASPGGPRPPGWDSQTNPGLALCLIRVLIHFTFCHILRAPWAKGTGVPIHTEDASPTSLGTPRSARLTLPSKRFHGAQP